MSGYCAPPGSQAITATDSDSTVATVAQGQLRGRKQGQVLTFRRVPYAANPYLAEPRFRAPQPMPGWAGIRDASAFGPMPPQPARVSGAPMAGTSDDLCLNIWAPLQTQGAPVLVWLPGGAFYRVDASEDWCDGSAFAREGVVVVTVNYRMGMDGFMWVDGMPANRGYLDQVAALKWVQDNIAAFGGNPDDVTLAGQSAGAQSVMALMGMPAAQGLFHRCIAQSPPMGYFQPEQAQAITLATAADLKVEPTAAALANVPLPAMVASTERMVVDLRDRQKWGPIAGRPPYLPVVGGTVVVASPLTSLQQPARPDIPLLIGCNDEEARFYLVPSGEIDQVQAPAVRAALQGAALPARAPAVYAQTRPDASPGDMLAAFMSDDTFRMPALRFAETCLAAGAPVWSYHFAWRSPAYDGRLGASHAVDVAYAFNALASQKAAPILGGQGLQTLADALFGHWLRFLKTGNPGWARYDLATRPTMRFDVVSAVVADPLAERRQLWAGKTFN